jgi:two-component system response regulator AlgR
MNDAPLSVLIVDDEPLARLRLRGLLGAVASPAVAIAGEAASAEEAMGWLRREPVDLLLLDVRMPGRGGLALAAALRELPQAPAVVFVSAHGEHAVDAFDVDAVDYLTKPVRLERLRSALARVVARRRPPPLPPDAPVLVVTERGRIRRIPLAELLYLRAEAKAVTLRTAGAALAVDESLADLEHRLGAGFLRIHRNAIVAKAAVRALEPRAGADGDEAWAVRVAPVDEWLAVSRRQLAAVREALGDDDVG